MHMQSVYKDAGVVQPALVAASTTAINALTALVSSNGSTSATLSGSAALSVVNTLVALTANPAAVSPAAAPAALAGASIVSKRLYYLCPCVKDWQSRTTWVTGAMTANSALT